MFSEILRKNLIDDKNWFPKFVQMTNSKFNICIQNVKAMVSQVVLKEL